MTVSHSSFPTAVAFGVGSSRVVAGMDALTHNIESYLSPSYHPPCDAVALEGLKLGAIALSTAAHAVGAVYDSRRCSSAVDRNRLAPRRVP